MVSTSKTMKMGRRNLRCITTSPSNTVPGFMSGTMCASGSTSSELLGIGCLPFIARSIKTAVLPVKMSKCRTPSVFSLRKYPFSGLRWTSSMLCLEKLTGMQPTKLTLERDGDGSSLDRIGDANSAGPRLLSLRYCLSAPHVAWAKRTAWASGWSRKNSFTSMTSARGLRLCSTHHNWLDKDLAYSRPLSGFSSLTNLSVALTESSISNSYVTTAALVASEDVVVTSVTSICHAIE
mmetsp:Transcript_30292/g.50061  ORF Transcript_30292/g.50061 Transcript_30292/m.50061 type:complete len:236 (-) Transcript_30292:932-1639(-)